MTPDIPHGTSLTYFAEGAANVVYKIGIPASSTMDDILPSEIDHYSPATPQPTELEPWQVDLSEPDYSYLKGKLLRLRKDLPVATSVLEAQQDFTEHVAPLFEQQQELVQQQLIQVPEEIIDQLNSVLRVMDENDHRPYKRKGTYLAEAEYGLLVQDMSSRLGQGFVTIEIKPKWLAQSPSAPAQARRCRTCALRASRIAHEVSNKKAITPSQSFCPLHLVSGNEAQVSTAVREILKDGPNAKLPNEPLRQRLVAYFIASSLLTRICSLQQKLDPRGILRSVPLDKSLLTAMTLRDCTLYLKVPLAGSGAIEARVGDLDMKSPEKAGYWRSIEQQLISQNWYEAEDDAIGIGPCGLLS